LSDEQSPDDLLPAWVDPGLLDGAQRVATDVLCISCRYNLRTLDARQRCPECGQPVARSLYRLELAYAPEEWARELADGATILSVAGAMALLGLVVYLLPELPFGPIAATLFGVVAPITAAIGLYTLTARDPRPPRKPEGLSFRRAARWSVPAGLVVIATVVLTLPAPSVLPIIAFVCVSTIVLVCLLGHTVQLLRRAHAPHLAKLAKVLAIFIAGVTGMLCVYTLLLVPYRLPATEWLRDWILAVYLGPAAGFTFVFLRTRRVLRDTADQIYPRMPPVEM
jgi:hypothetical protein